MGGYQDNVKGFLLLSETDKTTSHNCGETPSSSVIGIENISMTRPQKDSKT